MACSLFDQTCIKRAIATSVARYSGGHPEDFDAFQKGISAAEGVKARGYVERSDVNFLIEHSDIQAGARSFVSGGFMSHFDTNNDSRIDKVEWAAGSKNQALPQPQKVGFSLRRTTRD